MMNQYSRMLTNPDTPFAITESFKEIRTNMLYTARDVACPIYAVTSCFAHAGKSIVIANLARSFSELGKRVLLIDCDLRSPVQHKAFQKDRSFGVSELAAGISNDIDKAILHTAYDRLDLLPSGHIPPNPAELLASENFANLLKAVQERYDSIFIDFPPAGVVVDALVPANLITGYVLIVRSGADVRKGVSSLVSSLNSVGAKILGFVLNDTNPKLSSYYGKGDRYKYKKRYRSYSYAYTHPTTKTKPMVEDGAIKADETIASDSASE